MDINEAMYYERITNRANRNQQAAENLREIILQCKVIDILLKHNEDITEQVNVLMQMYRKML